MNSKRNWLIRFQVWCYGKLFARQYAELQEAKNLLANAAETLKTMEASRNYMRSQLMTLRVSQTIDGRTGWEVSAYIPQGEAEILGTLPQSRYEEFITRVAISLVSKAVDGIKNVSRMGKVNALVFSPYALEKKPGDQSAPKWMQAVFEKDGRFNISERQYAGAQGSMEERQLRAMQQSKGLA